MCASPGCRLARPQAAPLASSPARARWPLAAAVHRKAHWDGDRHAARAPRDPVIASPTRALAKQSLDRVGLGQRVDHPPSELSGGQQQRVAIARALVTTPTVLLADEPTGNLDSRTSLEIMALFQELNEQGAPTLIVTHEPDVACYAKRLVEVRDGRILRDEPMKGR